MICIGIRSASENVLVGEANNESVARRVVLPLILSYQATTGLIIRLSLAATAPLGLVALAIGLVLCKLDASHCEVSRLQ